MQMALSVSALTALLRMVENVPMLSFSWAKPLMLLFDDVKDDGAGPLSQFSLSLLL
jgi:hypothetical protein